MRILKNLFIKPRKIIDALFLGTALLIIIPIVMLGVSLTWIFSSSFMKQTDRINTNTVDYVAELMVENLNEIYNAVYTLGSNENILKYESLDSTTYEYARNLAKINTVLASQEVQNDIIKEIYIFYKKSLLTLNASDGKFQAEKELIEHYGMLPEEIAEFLADNNGKFICNYEGASTVNSDILYAKVIDKRFMQVGNIYAVFVLDGNYINSLIDMISLEDVGQSLLLDAEYNLLLGDNEIYAKYEMQLKELESSERITSDMDLPVIMKAVEGGKLNLCFVVDNSHYVTMIRYIWTVIICVGIAIVVVSIFISKFYIRRLYRPFGNIVNMFKPEEEEYGFKSELEFFEEKYVEIKNMKAELEEYKNSEDVDLKEMFFYNFLKGFYLADYGQYMQDLNIAFETAYYTTVLVKIDNFKIIAQNIKLSHYRKFIKDKLHDILEEYGFEKQAGTVTYYFYDGECIGLLMCHDELIEDVMHAITYVQHELAKMLDITISVCVGDTVTSPEELVEEYKVLSNAMMQMKFCRPQTLLTMQDYKKNGKYVEFAKYKKAIIQGISDRDYEKLDTLIDELFICSNVYYSEIIQLVTGCLTVMSEMLKKNGNKGFRINGSEFHPYDEIGRMGNVAEIATYIKKLCKDIGDKLYAENSGKSEMYDKFITYISANYMKEITLTGMSRDFGLSPSYFSRFFKEITGKNYSEMINSYRVEKAKELICIEEEIKLFQVAELVGFASYKAFAEAFKKYAGMSPENYKKNRNAQNSLEI